MLFKSVGVLGLMVGRVIQNAVVLNVLKACVPTKYLCDRPFVLVWDKASTEAQD